MTKLAMSHPPLLEDFTVVEVSKRGDVYLGVFKLYIEDVHQPVAPPFWENVIFSVCRNWYRRR